MCGEYAENELQRQWIAVRNYSYFVQLSLVKFCFLILFFAIIFWGAQVRATRRGVAA